MPTRTIDTAARADGLLTMHPKYTHGGSLTVRCTENAIVILRSGFAIHTITHRDALNDALFTVGSMLGKW